MICKVRSFKNGLPSAPKPTKPVFVTTHSDAVTAEHLIRVRESKTKRIRGEFTEASTRKLIRLWNEGKRVTDISNELGIPYKKVSSRLGYLQMIGQIEQRQHRMPKETLEIVYCLKDQGYKTKEISAKTGLTVIQIRGILRRREK